MCDIIFYLSIIANLILVIAYIAQVVVIRKLLEHLGILAKSYKSISDVLFNEMVKEEMLKNEKRH